MLNITVKADIFNPCFRPIVLDNKHRLFLLVGGAGSGKSFFIFQRIVLKALQEKRKILVLRKSATDLRRSCWEDLLAALKQFQIYDKCKVQKSMMTVELPNGSEFVLMGLDDPDKIKSIPAINDIVVEECSEINLEDFSQIKQRTRGRSWKFKNQIYMMCNPVAKTNWVYKHFFEDGCKEFNTLIHRSTYKDNPFLNKETVAALEGYKTTNPYYYRVYCLGEWGSLSKTVFTNYRMEHLDLDSLRKEDYQHLVGLDFGFVNDPTAIIESLLDEENKRLYITREHFQTGLLNDEIANLLQAMGLSKTTIVADSAEQKSIEEIRRKGISRIQPATKGQGSINQGIQQLQQYEIIINDTCLNLMEEFENYSWKKDKSTGEYLNQPIDEWNHGIDALRYSLQCSTAHRKLKVLPRNVL